MILFENSPNVSTLPSSFLPTGANVSGWRKKANVDLVTVPSTPSTVTVFFDLSFPLPAWT
jgi:hypothetical protein